MKLHRNARTCPHSRRLLVERIEHEGWRIGEAARAAGVSERTACKWLARWRGEGASGLLDRSSAPRRIPHRTPVERVRAALALRRLRLTAAEIAEVLALPLSTVSALLRRHGLGRLSCLQAPEPANRYERRHPGELVHVDVKKLARFARPGHRVFGRRAIGSQGGWDRRAFKLGWEYLHVCVDDASRLAYAELLEDERGETVAGFLARAVAWYSLYGITVARVMTDNGAGYHSTAHAVACRALRLRHLTTRPHRPRTNGKAERFIQTALREWAYGRLYGSSAERASALAPWLWYYNFRRRHGSLGHQAPGTRLTMNNVARNYT
jgi:transposase InsO family protein